ncbi:AAA family ATPase [Streptomyces triticisoli]|uniref:AAA family ATPase n=1 Tax=Streptomyces triticisoli TaxID=2182797 RepID=UPI000DDA886D|nr:AAA family ATPase [Streptomyces triticisoli]
MLYVICGPPAAGKSSWIAARARPTDIVIDLDRIALALAGPDAPPWQHDETLLKVAHRARFAALDEAVKHRDQVDVYLIHTMPSAKALARYHRLDAKIVTVDPGEQIVRQRVRDMRAPGMDQVVTRWYRQRKRLGPQTVSRQASREW